MTKEILDAGLRRHDDPGIVVLHIRNLSLAIARARLNCQRWAKLKSDIGGFGFTGKRRKRE
jgi:hypothetical protein